MTSALVSMSTRLLLALILCVGIGFDVARAEIPSAAPPVNPSPAAPSLPFSVGGWKSQRPNGTDVTFFLCQEAQCGPGSKVSYRLYAPDATMTVEQFRASQEQTIRILDERVPGQTTTILGVEGDKGTGVPRVFRVRRLKVAPDGTREYQVSGMLFGSRGSASLISSASSETNSTTNFAQFAIPVLVLLGVPQR
ncbi:hypothetical protein [Bradyrhizobium sp. HKCCYLS20291]|uniref:hypothetical protein n=1 Tax=Bradyrhizobium sp. HKCCYLS20291 TaxID=3420766 RepID=UPI003EBE6C05